MDMNTRHEILHPLIVLGLFAFAPTFASAAVPAFPGAQGGGAVAVGGRGGAVIPVTNLNDSGAGSLRACIAAAGPRTCVFRVGGTINFLSEITILNPFLTIAGQTAPGGGIQLAGKNMTQGLLTIRTNDVVIRYIKIRKGYNSACVDECGTNLVAYATGHRFIIDHVSSHWNQDEALAIGGGATGTAVKNVTFSYNIVAEGLSLGHSTGFLLAGAQGRSAEMTDIDLHHNLSMNNTHRNPLMRIKSGRLINNLWYNHKSYANHISGGVLADIIGNKYKAGPLRPNPAWHEIGATITGSGGKAAPGIPSLYIVGNVGWHQTNPAGDQTPLTSSIGGENGPDNGPMPVAWRRASAMANTTHPITAEPVADIEKSILPIVGASRRVDCDGKWVLNRDSTMLRW